MNKQTPPPTNKTLNFLSRALLPVVVLGIGLFVLSRVWGGIEHTYHSTFRLRIAGGLLFSAATFVMIIFTRSSRTPADALNEPWLKGVWRGILVGAGLWIVPAVISFGVLTTLGAPLAITAPAGETLAVMLLVLGAVFLSEAIPEELVFRGQLMSVLSERLGTWLVIIMQATLFTAFALALRGWTGVTDLSLFIGMGIGLGYLRALTGSVWITVGFHAAFQSASQLVLAHDVVTFSGSETASMIALGAIPFAVAATLVAFLAPKYPRLFRVT